MLESTQIKDADVIAQRKVLFQYTGRGSKLKMRL